MISAHIFPYSAEHLRPMPPPPRQFHAGVRCNAPSSLFHPWASMHPLRTQAKGQEAASRLPIAPTDPHYSLLWPVPKQKSNLPLCSIFAASHLDQGLQETSLGLLLPPPQPLLHPSPHSSQGCPSDWQT